MRGKMRLSVIFSLIMILAGMAFFTACGGEGDDGVRDTAATETREDAVITIGNLTDKTGASSSALSVMDMALEDMVNHYNENELIPGVRVRVVSYDARYDPSKHTPGYLWLRERGADLIYCADPNALETLKSRADRDRFLLFASSAQDALLGEPGYAFCAGTHPSDLTYTALSWIAENDWDYELNGPAKVGIVGWQSANIEAAADGMKAYCREHPEQFEWGGSYQTQFTFTWQTEVHTVKDFDYVYPPMAPMVTFAKEYRDAGGRAKFIGLDAHAAFFDLVTDARVWDDIDGMIFGRESKWWNEEGELIDLTRDLLYNNHPDSAEKIIRSGCGYLATSHALVLLETIKKASQAVGPENIDSEALYEAAKSLVVNLNGLDRYSFSETKRLGNNYLGFYEAVADEKDIFRLGDWVPLLYAPRD
ncbi:MAG: ABC transporter substrate-binding protein [Dehalococcoidia bacterium]